MESGFSFRGRIPPSKSSMNRWLCVGSYARQFQIEGDSRCDDVVKMRSALAALLRGDDADCGAAGTVLRFLAFRASRLPGRHVLRGSSRLFSRPQSELVNVLSKLGVRTELLSDRIVVESAGWRDPGAEISVDR